MSREAMRQVLEALENCHRDYRKQDEAITALKQALAEPEQEPDSRCPVCGEDGGTSCGALYCGLVTAAPTPRKPEPLSDDEILRVLRLSPPEPSLWPHLKGESVVGDVQQAVIAIARAIERAHGIKEQEHE